MANLRVIGVGLNETGERALSQALESICGGRCYTECTPLLDHPEHYRMFYAASESLAMLPDTADAIYAGYTCAVGFPTWHFARDLLDRCPGAKAVLTLPDCDPLAWAAQFACGATAVMSERERLCLADRLLPWRRRAAWNSDYMLPCYHSVFKRNLGAVYSLADLHSLVGLLASHRRRIEGLGGGLPHDRLLLWRESDGTEPLRRFLGVVGDGVGGDCDSMQRIVSEHRRYRRLTNTAFVGVCAAAAAAGAAAYLT